MGKNITPTVEGGLLTAIAVILGLAATYLPVLGVVVEFFCAVPFVVLTVRHGAGKSLMALIVSFILLGLFTGPLLAARISLTLNVSGVVLGFCLSRGLGAVKSFLATFVSSFVSQILMIIFLLTAMGINFSDAELSIMKETFEETFQIYESMGVQQATIDEMKNQAAQITELMSLLMPMILILLALVNTIACYATSKMIFQKLRLKFAEPLPPFAEWRFPVIFLYLSAFSMIGLYWGSSREWNELYTVSINALIFSMGAGLVQGFSILSFVADRWEFPKFWRRLFFIFIILNSWLTQILAFTGLFDMLFDYRKKFSSDK